jgi:hypothetical protein
MTEGTEKTPMELNEWKARVQDGEDPSDVLLYKEYTANFVSKSEDQPESRLVDFVLNTGKADRYNDIIAGDGWELDNYKKNPVVLWLHNQSFFAGPGPMPHAGLPIARGVNLEVVVDSLLGSADFFKQEGEDISEAAKFIETTYQMVKGGFLNAVSVGFAPLEHTRDDERGGINFIRQELLEFSVVPIPADSDALRRAVQKGIDVSPIHDWAVETLESGDELVVPRKKLEAVVKGLGYGRGAKFFDMKPSEIKAAIKTRIAISDDEYIEELENRVRAYEEDVERRRDLSEPPEEIASETTYTVEKVGEPIVEMGPGAEAELLEVLESGSEITIKAPEENGWIVETATEIPEPEAAVEEYGDESVLVLKIVEDEPEDESEEETAEGEELFRVDPEELKDAIEHAVADRLDGMKQLFTKATGQVL